MRCKTNPNCVAKALGELVRVKSSSSVATAVTGVEAFGEGVVRRTDLVPALSLPWRAGIGELGLGTSRWRNQGAEALRSTQFAGVSPDISPTSSREAAGQRSSGPRVVKCSQAYLQYVENAEQARC